MRNSWVDLEDTREPSLAREIGKVAWLFAKVTGAILAVLAVLFPLFYWSPVAGMMTTYGLAFAAIIIQAGYRNYKMKKNDLKWKKQREEDTARWDESGKHLRE